MDKWLERWEAQKLSFPSVSALNSAVPFETKPVAVIGPYNIPSVIPPTSFDLSAGPSSIH